MFSRALVSSSLQLAFHVQFPIVLLCSIPNQLVFLSQFLFRLDQSCLQNPSAPGHIQACFFNVFQRVEQSDFPNSVPFSIQSFCQRACSAPKGPSVELVNLISEDVGRRREHLKQCILDSESDAWLLKRGTKKNWQVIW